ncbi:hypothetical protein ACGAPV_000744 [Morganella morganii]
MSEISSLATDKDIASMLLDLSNVISILIGGIIGFIVKYFFEFKKMRDDKKSIKQQMITNNIAPMRQEWINDLRSKASRFFVMVDIISSCREARYLNDDEFIDKFKDSFITSLMEKKELELYLTMALPFSRDKHEEKIPDIIRDHLTYIDKNISHETIWNKEKLEEIDNVVTCCANHFKVLFKNEWDETKSLKEIDSEKYKIEKLPPPKCTCPVKNK